MEGLKFPKNNSQNLACLLINSNLYYKRVSLRYQLTNEVLLKNKIYTLVYQVKSADKITQAFEIIALGSYVSFWLAILNKIDPAQIPWVEYFKKRLT